MSDPIAWINAHPYIAAVLAIVLGFYGQRQGWWSVLLAKFLAHPAAPIPATAPVESSGNFASTAALPMSSPLSRSDVRLMIREQIDANLFKDEMQSPEPEDPTGPLADDSHLALEMARRRPDQHEALTKVASDLIKQAAIKPA